MQALIRAAVAGWAAVATPVLAAQGVCGPSSSPDPVQVVDWSVTTQRDAYGRTGEVVTISLGNISDAGSILAINGEVRFTDQLGRYIVHSNIKPDLMIEPEAVATWTAEYRGSMFARVAALARGDVTVTACTKSIALNDGTLVSYGP